MIEVKSVRLVGGEEVIGQVQTEGMMNVTFTNLMTLQTAQTANGLVQQLVQWPAFAAPGQSITVPKSVMLCSLCSPHPALEQEYTTVVTGIAVPQQPSILQG